MINAGAFGLFIGPKDGRIIRKYNTEKKKKKRCNNAFLMSFFLECTRNALRIP